MATGARYIEMQYWLCSEINKGNEIMKMVCCVCRNVKGEKDWSGNKNEQMKGIVFGICPECYNHTLVKIKDAYATATGCNTMIVPRPAMLRQIGVDG